MKKALLIALVPFILISPLSYADAVCNDGWKSKSNGSGACSWHGGVSNWITKNRPSNPRRSDDDYRPSYITINTPEKRLHYNNWVKKLRDEVDDIDQAGGYQKMIYKKTMERGSD